jgi:hypothetical protein
VERIFFFGGIGTVIGGFAVIFYQGLTFLKSNVWNSYSGLGAIGAESGSVGGTIAANGTLANVLDKCPLSAAIIALGLIFLWIASKYRNRYA